MKRPSLTLATLVTSAAAALAVMVAPAASAYPIGSARSTIDGLKFAGYAVNIDRVGDAPIDTCSVTSVRNPRTITRLIKVYKGHADKNGHRDYDLVEIVVSRSIQVSLDCTNPNVSR